MKSVFSILACSVLLNTAAWAQPSPDQTTVPPATQIVDTELHVWTIGPANVILRDGAQWNGGTGTTLTWCAATVRVLGMDSRWYDATTSGWNFNPAPPCGDVPPPPPPPPPVDPPPPPPATGDFSRFAYRLDIFPPGTVLPTAIDPSVSVLLQPTAVMCDQDPHPKADPAVPQKIVSPLRMEFDDPSKAGRSCATQDVAPALQAAMTMFPAGLYAWTLRQESDMAPGAVPLLQKYADPATSCAAPVGRLNVLSITIGNYTSNLRPGASGQVAFQVVSKSPVVALRAFLNGIEAARVTGTDVGATGGLWFRAPAVTGTYSLVVDARDAYGCVYRSGLSRPVKVQ